MAKAKKRAAFSISIGTASARPPLKINLNRPLLAVLLLVGIAIIYLAGLSVYNMLTQDTSANGNDLAFQGSSSVREREREDQIVQLKNLNTQLVQENNKYKQDIADLDTRVKTLADSLETLKSFAKQLQDRLGGLSVPEPPPVPTPSGSTGGNNNAAYLYGENNAGLPSQNNSSTAYYALHTDASLSSLISQGDMQNYYAAYDKAVGQLQNINLKIATQKQSIAATSVKIQDYQKQVEQAATSVTVSSSLTQTVNLTNNGDAPSDVPVDGPISSPFGWRPSPFHAGAVGFHYGIDIAVPMRTPVRATKAGVVTYAGYDDVYGWKVEITHSGGWLTFYAHNTILLVKVGQQVDKGAIIALSGTTGASTGPHVHYEVHYNGTPVDPAIYMKVPLKYATGL